MPSSLQKQSGNLHDERTQVGAALVSGVVGASVAIKLGKLANSLFSKVTQHYVCVGVE